MNTDSILGCLLGTAVGDALGLPTEGLSRRRAEHQVLRGLQHRLVFGRGMLSDDTEHTLMLAASLRAHRNDERALQRDFARQLRWWIAALPAGVGLSTARAIGKLWLGFPANRSGVRSAGNGAAMRSAIVGVTFAYDVETRHRMALAACRVTHTDPRAEESALLVAEAAALAAKRLITPDVVIRLRPLITSTEMRERFADLERALSEQTSVPDYAAQIGCENGVSGFAPNTVAVALFAWLRHRGDFEQALTETIRCGGDTDSVAAITGAICGAEVGEQGIPPAWINGIWDCPRSINYIRRMADPTTATPQAFWPASVIRNLIFLSIVLLHGFRRLLPPY
jgi:ADP-ribosyl-[dinitrogen reductase] hydrolase